MRLPIFDVFGQIISIVSLAFVLVRFRWQIVIIIIIIPVCRSLITFLIDKEQYEIRKKRTKQERKKWYTNYLIMTGSAFKEIKTLGLGPFLLDKYGKLQDEIITQENRMYEKSVGTSTVFNLLDWLVTGGIYVYCFYLGFENNILIGDLMAYIDSTGNIKGSVEGMFSNVNNLVEQSMYVNQLFEYLGLSENMDSEGIDIASIESIEFQNVCFKYSNGKYALKNVSFLLRSNESIAVIGENGSGKTTLIKLILGLYNEYEGKILINDINLKKINKHSYQRKISNIFQDYIKYETSIRENVAFGALDQMRNDKIIIKSLQKVQMSKYEKHREGIDTVVGNWFGGQQLSGGEWQKIAIARAIVREANVYIFDEPDSSLDIYGKKGLICLFKEISEKGIGIYVSHSINFTTQMVDKIIVIHEGELSEMGTHEELMENGEKYYQIYAAYEKKNES